MLNSGDLSYLGGIWTLEWRRCYSEDAKKSPYSGYLFWVFVFQIAFAEQKKKFIFRAICRLTTSFQAVYFWNVWLRYNIWNSWFFFSLFGVMSPPKMHQRMLLPGEEDISIQIPSKNENRVNKGCPHYIATHMQSLFPSGSPCVALISWLVIDCWN